MERLALIVGTFVGAVLKQCAPILAEIVANGIKAAIQDRAAVSKPNAALERLWDESVSGGAGNNGGPAK